jgi:hypothetical protein
MKIFNTIANLIIVVAPVCVCLAFYLLILAMILNP